MSLVHFDRARRLQQEDVKLEERPEIKGSPLLEAVREQDSACGLLGLFSGPQPESSWTRPRWSGLTSWPRSQPFLWVRYDICAVNHLTTNQDALIGACWVPCECMTATGLSSPMA